MIKKTVLASLCMSVAGLAPALAGPPESLQHVPSNAVVAIVTPSLDALSTKMQGFTRQMSLPVPPEADLKGMLMAMGVQEGVNTAGSMAIAILPDAEGQVNMDGDTPPMVAVIPVANYDAFLANFGANAGGAVDMFLMQGSEMFAKNLGNGYALASPFSELVTGADGGGMAGAMNGANGDVLAKSDLAVVANIKALGPTVLPMLKENLRGLTDMANMMNAAGGGQDITPMVQGLGAVLENFFTQSDIAVAGIGLNAEGLSIDLAAQFREGTELAGMFAEGGSLAPLWKAQPKQKFLLAGAVDGTNPSMKPIMQSMMGFAGAGDPGLAQMQDAINDAQGYSMVMGVGPGGLMAGMFASTTAFYATRDNNTFVTGLKDAIAAVDGQNQDGISMTSSYESDARTIAGVSVDAWSLRMNANDPNVMQMMGMMWGAGGGPAGYVAKTNGGIVMTMSQNPDLTASAIAAANGEADATFADDASVASVAAKLPEGRIMEGYLGLQGVLETVGPIMAMMTGQAIDAPANLAPIGMAMSGGDGASRVSVYVPASALKVIADLAQMAPTMAPGGGGQPRF